MKKSKHEHYWCRIHPSRPAHIMVNRGVWLCHDCLSLLEGDPAYYRGYGNARDYAVSRFLEKQFILCPGCAHEMAFLEDGQRELKVFMSSLTTRSTYLSEAKQELGLFLSETK